MWHPATSKGRKVLGATQTWRNRPGIPGKRYDPYLPSPGSRATGRDLRPPPEGRQGAPGEPEGGTLGRAKEEITAPAVERFLLDHRTHPPRRQRADASFPPKGLSGEQNSHPKVLPWARLPAPPTFQNLPLGLNTRCCLNPFLFPSSGARREGENDAHVHL